LIEWAFSNALPFQIPAILTSLVGVKLESYLKKQVAAVDRAMGKALPGVKVKPETIHQAMRYSVFAGGKRLRPVLCLAAAEACGGTPKNALPAACAVEFVHTYSLIHDDLPCMDDDDLRRGQPTSHKKFGEGVAVLAGDALLTAAFGVLAEMVPTARYSTAEAIRVLAEAAGSRFLIAGQVADLEAEGKKVSRAQLRFIHEGKTAAMIVASLVLGGMSANARPSELEALKSFGKNLGLAFQVIDDILDITQTTEKLGKSAGKDLTAEKSTYPALIGLDASRKEARRLTKAAHEALNPFGKKAVRLREIADYLLAREF
jgi:geranylgeranyl diphosphate synthase type II